MRSSPIIVALATFAAYVLSGHELDAETAFTSLALFGTIAHPFHVLPKVRGRIEEHFVALLACACGGGGALHGHFLFLKDEDF